MKITPLTELMHAVLDGEATSDEARDLERQLAADPAKRAEFDDLKRLFGDLARVPKVHPPEGLVASVMASLSEQQRSKDGLGQPFTAPRVIGEDFRDASDSRPGRSARDSGDSQQWPNFRSNEMSEKRGGSLGKRRIWIGGAIAAAAVVLVMSSGIDFPPGSKDTSGTIVPATRYKAPQNTAEDVKLGAPGAASSSTIPKAGEGASQAAGQAAGQAANQASGQAVNQASGQAANQASGQAANQASGQAANQASGQAANQASGQAANQASGQAANQASGQAANQASGQAANQASGQAANQASGQAANQASGQAANQASGQAANQASGQAANQASGQAANQASGQAANQASGQAANQASGQAANQASGQAANQASGQAVNIK